MTSYIFIYFVSLIKLILNISFILKFCYKSYLKQNKCNESSIASNSLHDALMNKDQDSFWKM